MLSLQVEGGGSEVEISDLGSEDPAFSTRFVVDKSTNIKFSMRGAGDSSSTVESSNQSAPLSDAADIILNRETNDYSVCNQIFEDFGGYNKEVYDAISVTHLGLGLIGGKYFNSYERDTNEKDESHIGDKSDSRNRNVHVADTQDGPYNNPENMGNNSLQASLSTQLFKPPKGLLIHGPAGTHRGRPDDDDDDDEAEGDSLIFAKQNLMTCCVIKPIMHFVLCSSF